MKRMLLSLCVVGASLLHAPPAVAGEPPKAPMLRIETGMHTAMINRSPVDADERYLVTGSDDKTARVWRLATGELLRTLRPPIGAGHEGRVYAVAIAPDGERVAVAGWTGYGWDGDYSIYLFDRVSGQMLDRITGLPNAILHLAYDRSGRRLAATLHGANGVRVFEVDSGRELFRGGAGDRSYWADFDGDGRLATTSYDGKLRLYGREGPLLAESEAPGGGRPFGLAFSPDDERIAVGYVDSTRVDVFSAKTVELLYSAENSGTNNDLLTVAWSGDGRWLYAAGRYGRGGIHPIRRWGRAGRGEPDEWAGPRTTVMALYPLSNGGLVYSSADPAWAALNARGERVRGRSAVQADPRGQEDFLAVGGGGRIVRFGFGVQGTEPAVFDLARRRLDTAPPDGLNQAGERLRPPRTSAPGISVSDWNDSYTPKLNGEQLALYDLEFSRSLAIARDAKDFVLGTEWSLRGYAADGTLRWHVNVPSAVWAVNLADNDRLVVAAVGDGTIRWYRAEDGEELLALFPQPDGRWVLWTPSGYYDASVDGEGLIGWHVNRGADQAADFFPAWQFRERFHRPGVIDRILETRDEAEALRRADVDAPDATLRERLPPVLTLLEPAPGSAVRGETFELKLNVRVPSGQPVNDVAVRIDGRPVKTRGVAWPSAGGAPATEDIHRSIELNVPRDREEFRVRVVARAGGLESEPKELVLRVPEAAREDVPERRAWVLAVGVGEYEQDRYTLDYADDDAEAVAAAWKALEGRAFDEVQTRVLTDADASMTGVLGGFDWLRERSRDSGPEDLTVLFLAGHGVNQGNSYYFLPHNANTDRPSSTMVADNQIAGLLRGLGGRTLLFFDTCRAGSLGAGQQRRIAVDPTGFANAMSYQGAMVFSAAGARELSQESEQWGHGAFTRALVGALERAGREARGLNTTELEVEISRRVRRLTNGQQHPVVAKASQPPLVIVPPEQAD